MKLPERIVSENFKPVELPQDKTEPKKPSMS